MYFFEPKPLSPFPDEWGAGECSSRVSAELYGRPRDQKLASVSAVKPSEKMLVRNAFHYALYTDFCGKPVCVGMQAISGSEQFSVSNFLRFFHTIRQPH